MSSKVSGEEGSVRGIVQPPPIERKEHKGSVLVYKRELEGRRDVQDSRSFMVSTHSHAVLLPPKTPHASHPLPQPNRSPSLLLNAFSLALLTLPSLSLASLFLPASLPSNSGSRTSSPSRSFATARLLLHALKFPHTPLQTVLGLLHAHVVGWAAGEGVKPSLHVNPHGFPASHTATP